jgi:hypothetical protein
MTKKRRKYGSRRLSTKKRKNGKINKEENQESRLKQGKTK